MEHYFVSSNLQHSSLSYPTFSPMQFSHSVLLDSLRPSGMHRRHDPKDAWGGAPRRYTSGLTFFRSEASLFSFSKWFFTWKLHSTCVLSVQQLMDLTLTSLSWKFLMVLMFFSISDVVAKTWYNVPVHSIIYYHWSYYSVPFIIYLEMLDSTHIRTTELWQTSVSSYMCLYYSAYSCGRVVSHQKQQIYLCICKECSIAGAHGVGGDYSVGRRKNEEWLAWFIPSPL